MKPLLLTSALTLLLCACTATPGTSPDGASSSSLSDQTSSLSVSSASSSPALPITFDANGIFSNVDELSFPYLQHGTGGMAFLKILTKDGIVEVKNYQEDIPEGMQYTEMLTTEGMFFVTKPSENTFFVRDRQGKDRTTEFTFLKGKPFIVSNYLRIDDDRYAYGMHAADGSETDPAGLYIKRISDSVQKHLPMSAFGLDGKLEGVSPVCLSADGTSLAVRHVGWEGFMFSGVWRVNLSDRSVHKVIDGEIDSIASFSCLDRSNKIIAIKTGYTPSAGMGGDSWPPSSLILIDWMTGEKKVLLEEKDTLIRDAAITPDGKKVVYTLVSAAPSMQSGYDERFYDDDATTEVVMMNIDGSGKKVLGQFQQFIGMSHDGTVIIAKAKDTYLHVINTVNGRMAVIPDVETGAYDISCGWARGFACHY